MAAASMATVAAAMAMAGARGEVGSLEEKVGERVELEIQQGGGAVEMVVAELGLAVVAKMERDEAAGEEGWELAR